MTSLKVYLLGAPSVEREGRPLRVARRKVMALIAFLAMTQQPQSRETLCALLWPEAERESALNSLRRTLSIANQLLSRAIVAEREVVRLDESLEVWVDVAEFRAAVRGCGTHGSVGTPCVLCQEYAARAVKLYRGDFLAGFTLEDSAAWDEWQFFQAEGLRRDLATTLERLVLDYREQGDWEAAIGATRRWLAVEPLHEPAHRHLMELYEGTGRHAAALRQFQTCARLLEQELAAPPDKETTGLHEMIQARQLPPLALSQSMATGRPSGWERVAQADGLPEPTVLPVHTEPLTFEQAWQHLPSAAREVLQRLAVFQGSFNADAAEWVAYGFHATLQLLAEQAFLHQSSPDHYALQEWAHPLLRAKLAAQPAQVREVQARHGAFYGGWLQKQARLLHTGTQGRQVGQAIQVEWTNVLPGWRWAIGEGDDSVIASFVDGLYHFFIWKGSFEEGEREFIWAGQQLQVGARGERSERARLARVLAARCAMFRLWLGADQEARALLNTSLDVAQYHEDEEEVAFALAGLGHLARLQVETAQRAAAGLTPSSIHGSIGPRNPYTAPIALAQRAAVRFEEARQGYNEAED